MKFEKGQRIEYDGRAWIILDVYEDYVDIQGKDHDNEMLISKQELKKYVAGSQEGTQRD